MKFYFKFSYLLLLTLTPLLSIQPASCCGGGGSLPQLITNDNLAQLGLNINQAQQIGQRLPDGETIRYSKNHNVENISLSGQYIPYDRFQVGGTLYWSQKSLSSSKGNQKVRGLKKGEGQIAYEVLPEYTYSSWKPKLFLTYQLDFPLNRSEYEVGHQRAISDGIWGSHFSLVGVKAYPLWDYSFSLGLHYLHPRTFATSGGVERRVEARTGMGGAIGIGFSPGGGDWRLGGTVEQTIYSPKQQSTFKNGEKIFTTEDDSLQKITVMGLQLSYMFTQDMTLTLSYSDSALLHLTHNAPLTRTYGFTLKKRFLQ